MALAAAAVELVTVALAVVGAVVLVTVGAMVVVGGGVVGLAQLTTNRNQRPAAVLHILKRVFT